jgi:hypothetical protein
MTSKTKNAVSTVNHPAIDAVAKPAVLSDRQLGRVTGLAAAGSTEAAIARSLGMSPTTWRKLKKDDERVAHAFAEGLAMDLNTCLNALRRAALDRKGDMRRRGGLVPLLAYLKMRHGLRDHGAAPGTDPSNVNVQIVLPAAMSHEQFAAGDDKTITLNASEVRHGTVRG